MTPPEKTAAFAGLIFLFYHTGGIKTICPRPAFRGEVTGLTLPWPLW
jgi:hypothetical protein